METLRHTCCLLWIQKKKNATRKEHHCPLVASLCHHTNTEQQVIEAGVDG